MYCVTGPVLDYRTKQFVGLLDQNTCPLCYGDWLVTVVSLWLMQRGLCFYSQFYFLSFSSMEYHYLRFQSPIIQSESFIQSEAPWLDDSRNRGTRVIFCWIFSVLWKGEPVLCGLTPEICHWRLSCNLKSGFNPYKWLSADQYTNNDALAALGAV